MYPLCTIDVRVLFNTNITQMPTSLLLFLQICQLAEGMIEVFMGFFSSSLENRICEFGALVDPEHRGDFFPYTELGLGHYPIPKELQEGSYSAEKMCFFSLTDKHQSGNCSDWTETWLQMANLITNNRKIFLTCKYFMQFIQLYRRNESISSCMSHVTRWSQTGQC